MVLAEALAYEEFRYGVEEENSRRNLADTSMLLRSALALLAVALFRFGLDFVGITMRPRSAVFVILILALLAITAAAALALGIPLVPRSVTRRFAKRLSSSQLKIPPGLVQALALEGSRLADGAGDARFRHQVATFLATHRAANDLVARNQVRATVLGFAKKLLAIGLLVALVGVGVMVYPSNGDREHAAPIQRIEP